MGNDLSALSMEDLQALKAGDLGKVSTAGLQALKGLQHVSAAEQVAADPITKGAQAVANASPESLLAGSAPGRFLLEPARGLMELGSHLSPVQPNKLGESADRVKQMIEEGRAAYENKGIDLAGIAGSVASPAVLKAAKLLPAATMGGKIASSALTGATAGAVTPTEDKGNFWAEKGMQTGTGAGFGTILPVGGALLRGLGSTIHKAFEPILPGGPEAILQRFQDKLIGPAKEKIIAALQSARELVPGSSPTAGEAVAGIPEASALAAHQKAVSTAPGVSGQFMARTADQEGARAVTLGMVAKTPAELTAAEAARSGEAAANYGRAFAETVKGDPTLMKLSADPYFKQAIPDAIDLAASKGINTKDNLTQFLHYVKVGLDKQLSRTGDTALASTEKEAVQGVKAQLTAWMDEKNPLYKVARERFAEMSRPINQMQVGQELQNKLAAPLGTSERAAGYAGALRDPAALIKETGSTRPLSEILTPEQLSAVQGVGADLGRKAQFERLARGTNMSGEMPGEAKSILPNLLSRPAMATNWLARNVLGHDLKTKITSAAGPGYLDPQALAASLQNAPPGALAQWTRLLGIPQLSTKNQKAVVDALMSRNMQPIVAGAPSAAIAQHY